MLFHAIISYVLRYYYFSYLLPGNGTSGLKKTYEVGVLLSYPTKALDQFISAITVWVFYASLCYATNIHTICNDIRI